MKLILLFLVALLPSTVLVDDFFDKVDSGYTSYTVLYGVTEEEQSNNYYHIRIIQGINEEEVTFGFALYNERAKSHEVVIESGGKLFYPKPSSRGDYSVAAVRMNEDVTLHVIDQKNKSKFELTIEKMSVAEFEATSLVKVDGEGKGLALESLSKSPKANLLSILLIVFGSICLVFGAIVVFMVVTKKGIFHPDRRKKNVYDFREAFNVFQQTIEQQPEDEIILHEREYEEQTLAEPVNPYPQMREYEEELENEVDVHALLVSKGYRVDYQNLTENEKNEVMLYLMQLRGMKDISEEQYKSEIIELWKK